MTITEAKRLKGEISIELQQIQWSLSGLTGREKKQAQAKMIALMKDKLRISQMVHSLAGSDHAGYMAQVGGLDQAPEVGDRGGGDYLLLEALRALVDLGCSWDIVSRIREYFKQVPTQPRQDNSDLDFTRTKPEEIQETTPRYRAEPSIGKLADKLAPIYQVQVPPKDPSPIRQLDGPYRQAPGPGTVLYRKAKR